MGTGTRGLNVTRRSGGDPWQGGEPAVPAVFTPIENPSENEKLNQFRTSVSEKSRDGLKTAGTAGTAGEPPWPLPGFDDEGTQALDALLATGPLVRPYRPDECPDCDGELLLVPSSPVLGGGFWYACPRCSPRTFDRS
jgi:hypothetical protein